jgi:hypothetical protein
VTNMISSQSSEPPPPPPPLLLPVLLPPLLPAAVTVSVAVAAAALPPAGPVMRALLAMVLVYVPTVALCTLNVMLQLPLAGILAPVSVTLVVVLLSDMEPPLHAVAAPGEAAKMRLAGKEIVMPDCVKANGLELLNVSTNAAAALTATLAGEKDSVIDGGTGVTVMSAMQADAAVPATDGAALFAPPLAGKLTTAVSVLPAESFTTSVKVPAPLDRMFTVELAAPETICTAPVLVHA